MANTNTPRGLVPLKDAGSKPFNGGLETFHVPASDATALYVGDPFVANGSADANGVRQGIRASAAGPITGVVQGFVPDGVTDAAGYRAASTSAYVLVATDPDIEYEIQADAAVAAASIGLNASMTLAAGNAYSRQSGVKLDTATLATTATLPLKVIGHSVRAGNEFNAAYNKLRVKINVSTEANNTAGL